MTYANVKLKEMQDQINEYKEQVNDLMDQLTNVRDTLRTERASYIEEINQLKDRLIYNVEAVTRADKMIVKQDRKIVELEAALEFYADPGTYHGCAFMFDRPTGGFDEDFSEDHGDDFYDYAKPGKKAREALGWDPDGDNFGVMDKYEDDVERLVEHCAWLGLEVMYGGEKTGYVSNESFRALPDDIGLKVNMRTEQVEQEFLEDESE